MHGFAPDDGFDLSKFSAWSAHKRKKVRDAYHNVMLLRSQPHYVFRGRNPEHIEIAQKVSHADLNMKNMKVAFIKYVAPRSEPNRKPRLTFRDGVMITHGKGIDEYFIAFDQEALATDTDAEIARIRQISQSDIGTKRYTIQCGAFEKAMVGYDGGTMKNEIKRLMDKYDGIQIPRSQLKDAKRGRWRAKDHIWTEWLTGVNVYTFHAGAKEKSRGMDVGEAFRDNRMKQKALRQRIKTQRAKMRKGRK